VATKPIGAMTATPVVGTLVVATANVLNLALPGRRFYANQDPYSAAQVQRKQAWLGDKFAQLNADICAVQEVWDEDALHAALRASGLRYSTICAPGAENAPPRTGAQGTPRVGLVTRLPLLALESIHQFDPRDVVLVPEVGEQHRFERPVLKAHLQMPTGQGVWVLNAHLKSKRPKFLQTEAGEPLEDKADPRVLARATLRSLMMRAAEAAALRGIVVQLLRDTHDPLILMGDLNDHPHSVTNQMVAATQEVAYAAQARDTALFNAYEVQGDMALKRDVAYSHIHQGSPEVLDQILVSEEFVATSRFAQGDVRRVDYFNDHLHEGRDGSRSDHGFVRALLRLYAPAAG
jgi:endonuclease/exonuclease/phosphatase family metal-dependent hydrolase